MKIVADNQKLADEMHGDLAVELVRPVANVDCLADREWLRLPEPHVACPLMMGEYGGCHQEAPRQERKRNKRSHWVSIVDSVSI